LAFGGEVANDVRATERTCVTGIGSSVLQCHRAVVMSRSPYFDRMFGNRGYKETGKREVELKEFNEVGMRAALQYMYTDRVDDIASCAEVRA